MLGGHGSALAPSVRMASSFFVCRKTLAMVPQLCWASSCPPHASSLSRSRSLHPCNARYALATHGTPLQRTVRPCNTRHALATKGATTLHRTLKWPSWATGATHPNRHRKSSLVASSRETEPHWHRCRHHRHRHRRHPRHPHPHHHRRHHSRRERAFWTWTQVPRARAPSEPAHLPRPRRCLLPQPRSRCPPHSHHPTLLHHRCSRTSCSVTLKREPKTRARHKQRKRSRICGALRCPDKNASCK